MNILYDWYTVEPRLAYKSSLESAKLERAQSASERELDLFPLLEIESSDVILAQTFQGAKLSNCQLNAFLSFQSFQRIFGNVDNCIGKLSQYVSKRWECFRTKPKYVENHLKIGPTHYICKTFSNVDNAFEQ